MDNREQGVLPGFRFHPTDEEIVSFYLRRKIEKKLGTRIDQFIKQVDIYKYDPWDLPKNSDSSVTDMEWYFFCKRGRKYRNSIRPNRVTGSGFWKATGIDKAIYSSEREGQCIGLKKSLVFYRGSAGKGTKTDWMMHEFRLPESTATPANANAVDDQQVEVWTLCRILKRNMSYRKSGNTTAPADHRREVVWKTTTDDWENFGGPEEGITAVDDYKDDEKKVLGGGGGGDHKYMNEIIRKHVVSLSDQEPSSSSSSSSSSSPSTALISDEAREFFAHGNWDEMVSAAAAMDEYEYAFDHFLYSRNIAFASI